MELKQLSYFVQVAELGSFSRAASLLAVAQSVLSHKVRQLEVELKQPLLYRNGRGVTPTEAGKRLLVHARGILAQVTRTRGELAGLRGTESGHVVLAMPPTIARRAAVALVKEFTTRYPGASLALMEGLSANILEWVATGRVDVGVAYNPAPSPSVEIRPWYEAPMFLISAAAGAKRAPVRPVALKDVPRYPLIVPSRPNANRMRVENALARLGLKPAVVLEIDGIASTLDLVHEGYGHAIMPLASVRGHRCEAGLVARPVVRPKLVNHMAFVMPAQRPLTPLAGQMPALVREIAAPV